MTKSPKFRESLRVLVCALVTAGAAWSVPVGAPPYLAGGRIDADRVLLLARSERLIPFSHTPNFKSVREVGAQLVARGNAALARGDERSALDCWLAVLRLSCAVGRGATGSPPVLVEVMVARAVERLAVEALTAHARSGRMTARGAGRVMEGLNRRDREHIPSMTAVMENEGRFASRVLAQFERAVQAGDFTMLGRAQNYADGQEDFLRIERIDAPDRARVVRALAERTKRLYVYLVAEVAAGRVPTAAPAMPHAHNDRDLIEPRWKSLAHLLVPNLPAAFARAEQREREVEALRTLCEPLAR